MSNALEIQIAREIRAKKLDLKIFKRQETVDSDELITRQSVIDELLEKYNSITDGRIYAEKIEDIAFDFCEEFFYELGQPNRDEIKIGKFYDLDASLSVVGKEKFVGKLDIINSIVDKYRYLKLEQTIDKITVDVSMSKGGVIHFECTSKLKINEDSPRKIMQMLDIIRSSLPTTYPYVIKREYFVVQDARPLYHWPENKIAPTKHDNWEPQFKPKVIERPKSAVVVVEEAPVVVEVVPVEDDEDNDNEDEVEGELVEDEGDDVVMDTGEVAEGEVLGSVQGYEGYEGQEYEPAEGEEGTGYVEGEYTEEGQEYDSYEEET